jgi:hypothetical protein
MSEREDILWALQRQGRALEEVLADARLVWRDANARAAEQRFLQPRAEAESSVLRAVGAQHQGLNSAAMNLRQAEEQRHLASSQSMLVGQDCELAGQSARAAQSEASNASAQAAQADQSAVTARSYIAQANVAGGE